MNSDYSSDYDNDKYKRHMNTYKGYYLEKDAEKNYKEKIFQKNSKNKISIWVPISLLMLGTLLVYYGASSGNNMSALDNRLSFQKQSKLMSNYMKTKSSYEILKELKLNRLNELDQCGLCYDISDSTCSTVLTNFMDSSFSEEEEYLLWNNNFHYCDELNDFCISKIKLILDSKSSDEKLFSLKKMCINEKWGDSSLFEKK